MNTPQPTFINNDSIMMSVNNYQTKVNKRRKYLVSAHGQIPRVNERFEVPDNVLILFLTPYGKTVDALASNLIMLDWYRSKRAMSILEKTNLTRRGRYDSIIEKPTAVERAYIAPPGLYANNLDLFFPDWNNPSNKSKQWERNEMGIFSLPVRGGGLKSKDNNGRYKVPRLSGAFRYTPPEVTLKDIAEHLGTVGEGEKKGGILIIDACRATNSNSGTYCRRTGCGDKSTNRAKCNATQHERKITKTFLKMLRESPRYLTRSQTKQIVKKVNNKNNSSSSSSNKNNSSSSSSNKNNSSSSSSNKNNKSSNKNI